MQEYLESLGIESLIDFKRKCDENYYNGGEDVDCIADDVYDILEEVIQKKSQTSTVTVGTKPKIKQIKLPFYMGSMNKFKTDKEIMKWSNKYSLSHRIVQEKLDGVSCLVLYNDGGLISLFTRGDGTIGSNISHLVPFLPSLPKCKSALVVRGELIIPKEVFKSKYASTYSNSRNLVSGIVNSTINIKEDIIKDIDFVAYELITKSPQSSDTQLKLLKKYGFKIVKNEMIDIINAKILGDVLNNMKENSNYQIDGIIIHTNSIYKRNTEGNPDYAFAFKMRSDDNISEATVTDIEWNVTKWNVLKPRIKIEPIPLCGVTIKYITGFNARYIKDNKIGIGSVLLITRSNDVIPYILKVIKATGAYLPPEGTYRWNETNIDIIADDDEEGSISVIKIISYFFQTVKIKQISDATVDKMFSAGLNTFDKIFKANVSDFEKIDGFGKKLAERTYNNIRNGLKDVPLYLLIAGSCTLGFGLGIKKVKKIFDIIPNILEDKSKTLLYDKLMNVEGLSHKSVIQIIDNLEKAREFYKMIEPFVTLEKSKDAVKQQLLNSMKVCFTGFRDLELEKAIEEQGGKIVSSVSKNTTYLVVKSENPSSSKIEKAKELNVKVINVNDLWKKIRK